MNKEIIKKIASEINFEQKYVERVLQLLAEDNTIAFISRYRKDFTNGMDEENIKLIANEYEYQEKLLKRKEAIIKNLEQKEMLTSDLLEAIQKASKLIELENIYKPYASGKKTKASIAIDKGLKPLAEFILKFNRKTPLLEEANKYINKDVKSAEEALEGAMHIIAEIVSNDLDARNLVYKSIFDYGKLVTKIKNKEKDIENKYHLYYEFNKPVKFLKNYQIMALDRAQESGVINISFNFNKDFLFDFLSNKYTKKIEWEGRKYIEDAVKDGLKRLLFSSVENQIYSELLERAHEKSADIFAKNLTNLLLQKPISNKVILGWDPGFRTGCKLAVINHNNEVFKIDTIYPTAPKNDYENSEKTLLKLIDEFKIDIIAIGNGTASWESVEFVAKFIKKHKLNIKYIIVSEAGASVYSASAKGIEEFPDLSVEQRSAISIARRMIDPLSELIKIEPQSIGVGQYQHDIKAKTLKEKVDFATTICVNNVGVNVNTASVELLTQISGFNNRIAKSVVNYIQNKGNLQSRDELLDIPYLSEKVFEQSAGFLRVENSKVFFDRTSIHPEMYQDAQKIADFLKIDESKFGIEKIDISDNKVREISQKLNMEFFKTKLILENFNNPLRDFRDEFEEPVLRDEVIDPSKVAIGTNFVGVVRNITDFGAFVDLGLKNDVLLHPSKLKSDIYDELNINQIINVEVDAINSESGKISIKRIYE